MQLASELRHLHQLRRPLISFFDPLEDLGGIEVLQHQIETQHPEGEVLPSELRPERPKAQCVQFVHRRPFGNQYSRSEGRFHDRAAQQSTEYV